jgi:hypothetical protein
VGLDFILNGSAHGDVAEKLMAANGDPRILRPWRGADGRNYVSVYNHRTRKVETRVTNATSTLRKDKAARPRLKAVADLNGAGLTYTIGDGMGKTVLQHETQSDISGAEVHIDGVGQSTEDRPEWEVNSLPLPIIFKDFSFSLRQILESRSQGTPIDTTSAESAGRVVAEEAEKFLLGTRAQLFTYAGASIYGYTNYPNRLTRTIANPSTGGWIPDDTIDDILAMQQQSIDNYYYGPWKLYYSTSWNKYMGMDYSAAKGDRTLLERIQAIPNITSASSLDFLSGYQILLVQMTSDVVRMVNGMNMTTVQWESKGGLYRHFKVMMISVPQLRCDMYERTGVVHGST